MKEHGIDLPQERIVNSNSLLSDGLRATRKLLKMNPRPDAVICANNPIALGVLQALQDKGIRIPDDMSLITFDSYPFSLFTEPQMTVVDINMYDMGQEAGRQKELINKEKRLILEDVLHPKVLADYDLYANDIMMMRRIHGSKIAYKLVWFIERCLFKSEQKRNKRKFFYR